MARPTDPRKPLAWQRRLHEFTASGMTVSKFCGREGVSVATFHYLSQRLGPQQPEQVSRLATPVFQAVDLLSQRAVVIRFAAGGGDASAASGSGIRICPPCLRYCYCAD